MTAIGWTSFVGSLMGASHASQPPSCEDEETLDLPLQWRGQEYGTAIMDAPFGDAQIEAVDAWASWVHENEYAMVLSDDGRILFLIAEKKLKLSKSRVEALRATSDYFWEIATPTKESKSGPNTPLEDIRETGVLIEFAKARDLQSALDHLAEEYPHVRKAVQAVEGKSGFLLWGPLVGGWLYSGAGLEEWNPKNELVNRSAQVLMLQNYGQQPMWLTLGLAWCVELHLLGTVYCFPYRDSFVAVGEHAGWENTLKTRFKKRRKRPLEIAELTACRRGQVDKDGSGVSWGMVRFLTQHRPGVLPAVLEDLRAYCKAHPEARRSQEPQIPDDVQHSTLIEHAGEDLFKETSRFFLKGRRYKPGKKR